jgi:hypothetical protein
MLMSVLTNSQVYSLALDHRKFRYQQCTESIVNDFSFCPDFRLGGSAAGLHLALHYIYIYIYIYSPHIIYIFIYI